MQHKHAVYLALFTVSLFISAPSSAITKSFEGRKLYTTYCLVCHGEGGKGNGPLAKKLKQQPTDLTRQQMAKHSDLDLFRLLETGQAHDKVLGGMPRWGAILPGPSIQAIVSYVRFLHLSKHPLIADPEAGRVVYANYCASCHGVSGKGDGVMTKFLPNRPADHTNTAKMEALSNDQLLKSVRDGTNDFMPGWKNVLSDSEIKAVVSYIRLLSH